MVAVAALAGSLDDFGAPPLLRLVARARRNGTLTVVTASQPVAVCFEDGAITYAGPADLEAARSALVGTGLVRADFVEAGLVGTGLTAEEPSGSRAVGAAAVRPSGLDEALADLAVNTVFELLLPSSAPFWFEPAVNHRLAGAQSLEAEQLIADATARLQAWRLIADVIPTTSVVVRLAGLLPLGTRRVAFDRDEWPVLAAIDGRRDVAAIITHTGLSAFGVCGVLHRLVTLGVAEPVLD